MKGLKMAKQDKSAGIVSSVSPRTEAPNEPAPPADLRGGRVLALEQALPTAHNWPLRVRLALVASWEIEALADLLTAAQGDEFGQEGRAARSVLNRVRTLAQAVMDAVSEQADDPEGIRERTFPDQHADFANLRWSDDGSAA